ncbi:MAG TPA: hypothetical protein VD999_07915 [Vitreimonas sp.]|nr:hypothetical protein [Vitreimonas sp.]
MAVSTVELVNNACALIGASFIISLDDATKTAITAKQVWPSVRDAVLRDFTWNCAEKLVTLGPLATGPAFGYTYAIQLPSDCIRIVSIEGDPKFKRVGHTIHINQNEINLTYIYRLEDVSKYDASLSAAMEARLAAILAFPILESKQLRDDMWALYEELIRKAKGVDSREKSAEEYDNDVWIASRLSNPTRNRSNR